jgi:transposase-like protein
MSGRRRFTDVEKARALDLYVNGGLSLDEVAVDIGCAKTTVRDWLIKAGVNPGELAANRDRGASQTEAATAARLAEAKTNREEFLVLLRKDITLPAARLLARKLARAADDEELVELARGRWRDALVVEAQATDFGPEAVKDARKAAMAAKVDVMVAEASVPDANDLSLILSRAARDLLAVEGYENELAEEDADGRLTVVFTAPRPGRQATTVVQLTEEAH